MRLGVVTHELPGPGRYGGVARYLEAMVPALQAADVDVRLFAPPVDGGTTLTAPVRAAGRQLLVPRDLIASADVELAFLDWLDSEQPDVVQIHHLLYLSLRLPQLCRQRGVPYVLHVHDMGGFCSQHHLIPNWQDPPRTCSTDVPATDCARCLLANGIAERDAPPLVEDWRWLGRESIEHAAAVVYVSDGLRGLFEDGLGWHNANSSVLLPALDWPQAQPRTPQTKPVFACMGHVGAVKGVDLAVAAVGMLDTDVELRIYGDLVQAEPYYSRVKALIDAEPRAVVHGPYRREQLGSILAEVDWLVCASRFEASPLIVHEAAACGVPALGGRIGGVPEKIGAGGLLFDVGDAQSLAHAMQAALEPGARERCAAAVQVPPRMEDQIEDVQQILATAAASADVADSAIRASVVIATHDAPTWLLRCVESMIESGWDERDELIVVDNASDDATQLLLDNLEGDVTVIRNQRDIGFDRARDQGATTARGQHLVFVEQASVVQPGWLDSLLEQGKTEIAGVELRDPAAYAKAGGSSRAFTKT
jgi:glycosyltransferase involved in cell wall biosynthesis